MIEIFLEDQLNSKDVNILFKKSTYSNTEQQSNLSNFVVLFSYLSHFKMQDLIYLLGFISSLRIMEKILFNQV